VKTKPLSTADVEQFARQFQGEAKIVALADDVAKGIEVGLEELRKRDCMFEHAKVLAVLADAIVRSLRQYSVGADLTHLALISRNILELEIIFSFVSTSSENRKLFLDDVILDEFQIREAVAGLGFDRTDANVIRRQDEALQRLRKEKTERSITRRGPMTAAEMARQISNERNEEYRRLNRFFSKVIHPTAYLLLGGTIEATNWDAYRLHLMAQGVQRADEFRKCWLQQLSVPR
jgi:hypothetical protein